MYFQELTRWFLHSPHLIASSIVLIFILHVITTRYNHIRSIPGPFLASFTNLYRFCHQWTWRSQYTQMALHKKYGKFVRYGPNLVSISDPQAIPEIYGIGKGFMKSEFYPVQQHLSNGKAVEGMFNTTSEAVHTALRRPVAHMYSQSTLVGYEPLVDSTIRKFQERMDGLTGECDFGHWLQCFAFDVIGELTFSKRLGFLETGGDVDGVMAGIWRMLEYSSLIGQIPPLDKLLRKNPVLARFSSPSSYVARFAAARIAERLAAPIPESADFLAKFLAAHETDPGAAPKSSVFAWALSNVNAGSDTTAITLSAIFYYILKNDSVRARLRAEIDRTAPAGIVSWADSQKMPYLDAVVKEALRLHPAVGHILERVVPPAGAVICGTFFPGGTVVGVNAWVIHRDKDVYGEDADVFRPERWLDADAETKRRMERAFLAFGAGARTCIGKNISRLEMYKLVPQMIRDYEIKLVQPQKEWCLQNAWFVKQTEIMVRMERRKI